MLNRLLPILFLFSSTLSAQCYEFQSSLVANPVTGNQIYIQPEFTSATYKTSEIKQTGYLYGVSGGYDVLVYNAPYLGFESHYRSGRLKGDGLSSKYRDYLFEGKIGLTMGTPGAFYFVPYGGVGYENEKNDYTNTPVEKLSYYYLSVGCLTQAFLNPQLSFGVNLKCKFPFNGDHDVKNDEIDVRVSISKKMQYLVEIPLTYWASSQLNIAAVPFYEHKEYNNNSTGIEWKSKAKMHQWGLGIRGTFCF